jgi:hypothetical protein
MQSDRTSRESAIEKVRKMLALAAEDSGATEPERMLAAQRAQEFMFRHNLDVLEIEAREDTGPEFTRDAERIEGMRHHWRGRLLAVIGKRVNVHVHYETSRSKAIRSYVMVGRPDSIAFVRELAAYLIPYLEAECEASLIRALAEHEQVECTRCDGLGFIEDRDMTYASQECPACDGTGEKPVTSRVFRSSFFQSAVVRIDHRLYQQQREIQADVPEQSMALVKNESAALKQHIEDAYPDLTRGRSGGGGFSPAGSAAGSVAGDRADLTPGKKLRGGQRELAR